VAAGALEKRFNGAQVEEAALFGALKRSLEAGVGSRHGVVQQCARDGGDRNAVADVSILVHQTRVVEAQLRLGMAAGGRRDVEGAGPAREQPPEPRRGQVAGESVRRTGEDGGEAAPLPRELRVADGIDAAVDAVETAGTCRPRDCRPPVTKSLQLSNRDHTVLPLGEVSQRPVRSLLVSHRDTRSERGSVLPPA
jgi:hypothetical protein